MQKIITTTIALLVMMPMVVAIAGKSTADSIAEYRAALQDGNPAELYEAKGEGLWKEKRGPKNASLAQCDLGKGMGVVKGAFVELPRFFADTGRVQDLESRLLTCLQVVQGFDAKQIANTPFGKGEQKTIESLVAYISGESKGMTFNVPQSHAKEKLMYEVGKKVFYLRGGPYDFSCASCHGEDQKRVRLQDLPNLTKQPGASAGFGSWPAYRVSSGDLWSMQRRLNDCYRQQRFPYPGYASDATVALGVFMGVNSKGGAATAPGLKR
jgi:sulfur-oxidizing protein SoxA